MSVRRRRSRGQRGGANRPEIATRIRLSEAEHDSPIDFDAKAKSLVDIEVRQHDTSWGSHFALIALSKRIPTPDSKRPIRIRAVRVTPGCSASGHHHPPRLALWRWVTMRHDDDERSEWKGQGRVV